MAATLAVALSAALFFNDTHLTAFACRLAALVLALIVFWAWIGLSIPWSEVHYASAINFWWVGTGLGTFRLAWPPFRNPVDTGGGFYVHNDYLQIAIETGVVGVAPPMAVPAATLARFRSARRVRVDPVQAVEPASLFAALVAVAAHVGGGPDLRIPPAAAGAHLLRALRRGADGRRGRARRGDDAVQELRTGGVRGDQAGRGRADTPAKPPEAGAAPEYRR